jgi:hypothetical protein
LKKSSHLWQETDILETKYPTWDSEGAYPPLVSAKTGLFQKPYKSITVIFLWGEADESYE